MSRGGRVAVFGLLVLGLGIVVFTVVLNLVAGLPLLGAAR